MTEDMKPPHKRQRLSRNSVPDADLEKRRARNDNQLKSIFESIFDKYGKDFDGIGDEIDLRTGEIVVNNGHLLGMTNGKDAGQVESPSEEVESEYSSGEEQEDRQDPNEGDAALVPESGTGLQHLYSIDYLMQDAEIGPLSMTFGRSLHGQIVDYESEEDELADSAIEWVTPREARAIAYKKWQLPGDGPTFIDDSIVEEAWRTPPLPKSTPPCSSVQRAVPATGRVREPMNFVESRNSLCASAGRKPRRLGLAKPPRLHQSASSLPSPNGPEAKYYDSSRSGGDRRYLPWTEEEEDLLRHLKENTTLTYREMDSCFPKRQWESVASKWTYMVNSGNASRNINKDVPPEVKTTSLLDPCPAWPNVEGGSDNDNDERIRYQRQPIPEADVFGDHAVAMDEVSKTFVSELSSLVQGSVDGYLRPNLQNVDASWLSGDHSTSAQTLSRDDPPALTNGQYLLKELQRGFRVQYPPDSHVNEIGRNTKASSPLVPVNCSEYHSGHAEIGVYVQANPHPFLLDKPQLHDTASPPPRYSQGSEDDAAMRRKTCVEQIAKYGLVTDTEDGPLPVAESGERFLEYAPVSDSLVGVFPDLHSSFSHRPDFTVSVPAEPTEKPLATPADCQRKNSISVPSLRPTQEVTLSLSSPMKPGRATKPDRVSPSTPPGVEHVVRVLIPRSNPFEVCKPTNPTNSGLAEETLVLPTPPVAQSQQEIVIPALCKPSRGSSPPSEAPLDSEVVRDVEIPDSQPEFSSPIFVNHENADSIVINAQSSSKTSPLARQHLEKRTNRTLANISVPKSEFDDELSLLTLRSKRQFGASATPPVARSQRSKVVIPLSRQARKKRDTKVTKTAINDSFSSLPSDVLDCSEDELSFR